MPLRTRSVTVRRGRSARCPFLGGANGFAWTPGARFPAVRESYKWVKRAARILKNEEGLPAKKVRRRLVQLLSQMRKAAATTGEPAVRAGLKQYVKVTRSYWPGLFHCYDSADLPRTNNDLEHTFGSHRYHERRASGRRRGSPSLVVMGSARVAAQAAPLPP